MLIQHHRRPGLLLPGLLVLGLLLVLAGCGEDRGSETPVPAPTVDSLYDLPRNEAGYQDMSVEQLAGLLPEKPFILVNVHVPYEGEIAGTDLFIPYNEIEDHVDQLLAKDEPIVLYCRSGSMSTSAAEDLVRLGYTNVVELDGGFNAWKAAGHELLDKPQ